MTRAQNCCLCRSIKSVYLEAGVTRNREKKKQHNSDISENVVISLPIILFLVCVNLTDINDFLCCGLQIYVNNVIWPRMNRASHAENALSGRDSNFVDLRVADR